MINLALKIYIKIQNVIKNCITKRNMFLTIAVKDCLTLVFGARNQENKNIKMY